MLADGTGVAGPQRLRRFPSSLLFHGRRGLLTKGSFFDIEADIIDLLVLREDILALGNLGERFVLLELLALFILLSRNDLPIVKLVSHVLRLRSERGHFSHTTLLGRRRVEISRLVTDSAFVVTEVFLDVDAINHVQVSRFVIGLVAHHFGRFESYIVASLRVALGISRPHHLVDGLIVRIIDTDVGRLREEDRVGVAELGLLCCEVAWLDDHVAIFIAFCYTRLRD